MMRSLFSKPWAGQAIALHDHQAVYYIVPKVACSSLLAVCVDLLGFELPEGAWKPGVFRGDRYDDVIDTRRRDAAKLSAQAADDLVGYQRFAFVRNPFDRLVSCYSEKIRDDGPDAMFVDGVSVALSRYGCFYRGMTFPDFARAVSQIPDRDSDEHFRSQWTFVCDQSKKIKVDHLGRFETLGADIAEMGGVLGESIDLPHLLKSDRSPHEDYYDDETRRLVRRRYDRDFRLLGYE